MFSSIAKLVDRHGLWIVLGWLVLAAILWRSAPDWNTVAKDDDVSFFPADYPSVVGQKLLQRGFPDDISSSSMVVIAERPAGKFTPGDYAFVDEISTTLNRLAKDESLGIRKVLDRNALGFGSRFVKTKPEGGQVALTVAQLRGTYVSREARKTVDVINRALAELKPPDGLKLGTTGAAVVGHDTNSASTRSVHDTTNVTILLVVAILLIVYRSPVLALIPMGTIALSAAVSLWCIALLTKIPGLNFQVINITDIFVIVVLFGAGTDYCLFLIARYREELARGLPPHEAVSEAIRQVGGALVASAGTVILGLGMLWFSTFRKIQYTGPAIALSLVIGLIGSLTLAPVFLHWLRGLVFWPFKPPHHTKGADPEAESQRETPLFGFWSAVSAQVVKRPGLILLASLVALTPLAVIGARTQSSYDLLADLGPDQPAIVGAEMFKKYYAFGELGPSTVLIRHPSLSFRSAEGRKAVGEITKSLAELPNVIEVRSLTRPLGTPLEPPKVRPNPFSAIFDRGQQVLARATQAQVDEHYVSTRAKLGDDRDHITRLDVVFRSSPFSVESLRSLDQVRQALASAQGPGGVLAGSASDDVGIAGTTVLINDLKRVTNNDEKRMYYLVTGGVYLILVALLRRPGICLYLIVTVILGYLASLGLTELVFKAFHHGPEPWAGLDWKVGFFLFVILVAVGEDYNIFLMARVIEEERKHGVIEGTRRAVAHTGGIISSCGVIMAGTFGSMLFGSLTTLKELGFALGLGVLLDTFVVRPILVPAFVVLLHRSRPGRLHLESPIAADEEAKATTVA